MDKTKVVLITGSSSGFGLLTTRTLLEQGYTVIASMRGLNAKNKEYADSLKKFAESKPGRLHLIELDVTSDSSVDAAVKQAIELSGHIDVVVNNAGFGVAGFAETITIPQFQKNFDVNVFGVQRVSRAVLPAMRKQGHGLIINISSIIGRMVMPFAGAYVASKYALEGLSESYRYELAGTGVDVVIVEPGGFGTNFLENMEPAADSDRLKSYGPLAEMPEKMWGGFAENLKGDDAPDPQVVADAIAKLIDTPAGQRPLRTVVDPMMGGEGPRAINQTTDKIQAELLGNLGMSDFISVKGN